MSYGIVHSFPQHIVTYNVARTISDSITPTPTTISQTLIKQISTTKPISPAACFGFVILILATVGGNTLVILALYLDKRLHAPSFYLIANMAIADVLLGLSVLPFSSVLELLDDRWIFGKSFCSAWLALDVLSCTASIMALMAVSIDRYIGVTRPLNYSSIMTTRRTIYLMIVVWAVSILTSVVPLFGLTDRGKISTDSNNEQQTFETCKVNKNTFYTILSSMISFYIPVIILLILYSRVYQEANKQGQRLENEKRRLYQLDYQIASEHVRRKQNQSNGHSINKSLSIPADSEVAICDNNEVSTSLINKNIVSNEECTRSRSLTLQDEVQSKKNLDSKSHILYNYTIQSGSSIPQQVNQARRSFARRISSTLTRNSQMTLPHTPHYQQTGGIMCTNDELLIIKRKLNNLKREKKAFRTLGLILSALLICWLPFFVTLPLMSILRHHQIIKDENTGNTWFKITFWLGYCNSALNPFVYAFSNRAIRRAFREVIFRRFCCCGLRWWLCRYLFPNKSNEYAEQKSSQFQRTYSNSFGNQSIHLAPRRTSSLSADIGRKIIKFENGFDKLSKSPITPVTVTTAGSDHPTVTFAFAPVQNDDEEISQTNEKNSISNDENFDLKSN